MIQDNQSALDEARDQLTLVLSFFPRIDAKASVVLAIDTGMLAVLASNTPAGHHLPLVAAILAVLAASLVAASLWFLYRTAFPSLRGGQQSLVYFREIAGRTESRFIEDFLAQPKSARTKDILGQVWRNSEIVKMKFDALRVAFILMALAIVPWVIAVALFAGHRDVAGSLLVK
ncbi:MAG TPA: Pycsar system effector family protein [Granulicella sp.]|jgi:hypothetical protein